MRNGAEQWGLLKAKSLRDNQIVKRGGGHVASTLQTELGLQHHVKVFNY